MAPLEDSVAEILDRRGITPKKLGATFVPDGHRVISAKAIKGHRVDLSADEPRFVNEETYLKWMRTPLFEDDVILTSEAPLGEPAYVARDEEWCLGQRLFGIRTRKNKLYGRFLFYALQSAEVRHDLLSRATGTTAQGIRQAELRRVLIPLPPLPEQRAIAHVLGSLDDKIELNWRMIETLEAMARALFKSWLVDFEPVRAKMDGQWRPGEPLPGLPADLYDLFPDRFVESEFGEIPEGWEVKALDDIADFLNGLALQKYPAKDGPKLPVIKIAQLRAGHTLGFDCCSAAIPSQYVIRDGDVLFSWSGSLELAVWAGGSGALNQHLFKVTSESYPKWLFYHWLKEHLPWFRSIAADKATTMGHIRRHHLKEASVVVPTPATVEGMDRVMQPLTASGLKLRTQSRVLAAQRDALLPKLVSGEMHT